MEVAKRMLLKGKNAIVTGTNRGIGQKVLEVFAENGANVWACARSHSDEFEKNCQELENKYKVKIWPVYFDMTNSEDMKRAVKSIRNDQQPVDILVNNAGITYNSLFQMTSMEKLKEVFEVNYFAPFLFSQYIVKLMQKRKSGSIINFSSTSGMDVNVGRAGYSASKAAFISTTRIMAAELGAQGIRVNAVAPGMTRTDMVIGQIAEQEIEKTVQATMLNRIGEPLDIANTVLYLASDLSAYVTGQVLRVDGGLLN